MSADPANSPRTRPGPPRTGAALPGKPALVVPIRSLGENHRARIAAHLMLLDAHDRYLRFGFPATDGQIAHYVQGMDFDRDEIFGIYNRHLQLIAMAHVAYPIDGTARRCAEFGVSVLAHARGRGFGARLFERAVMHARNQGVDTLYVHMLSENAAMLRIARHAGARVEYDGAEAQGQLHLPPATLNSRLAELVKEHIARANYGLKLRARALRERFGRVQAALRPTRRSG